MKTLLIIINISVFAISSLNGQGIDAQLQMIHEASPQERVKMMNELKRQIVQMNQNERLSAISKLRLELKSEEPRAKDINRAQFQSSKEMLNNQTLNQSQALKQQMFSVGQKESGKMRNRVQ
ncbi:MAG: hypothetical protein U9N39_08040 [Campylobacterota bacterium]|nr:hypothetical protein [Campylobacterota bacterium]